MKLYTTLVRVKQELNGGRLPPMTLIPASALKWIDPSLTPGLGALEEDPEKGLRCPVRGCGVWRHCLTAHANKSHADIGGAARLRRLLSIPHTAKLVSRALSERIRNSVSPSVRARVLRGARAARRASLSRRDLGHDARVIGDSRSVASQTAGSRCLRNTCLAQTTSRLIDLRNRLGRIPGTNDARNEDPGLYRAAIELFGSWNAALSSVGLQLNRRYWYRGDVLDCLAAFVSFHGRLPFRREFGYRVIPLLPKLDVVLGHLGAANYTDAMRLVSVALDIHIHGGLPPVKSAA